jgi:hypothetical protein
MKIGNAHWFKSLTIAALLLLAGRAHALYTNYLDVVSNTLAGVYSVLTNDPSPTRVERQQIALIGRALNTLAKPSTSVADDYALFVKAAIQLGPIGRDPAFLALGTNVFQVFTNEAQAEIVATGDRIAALSEFVRSRKAASNQLAQAQRTLNSISSLTDIQLALVVGRQVFTKIVAANRLAAIGEAHPGFAPGSVIGKTLTHTENGHTGTLHFDDATNATNTEEGETPEVQSYTWTRTGLNTATLELTHSCEGGGTGTTTVKIHSTSATGGTFTAHNVDCDGSTGNQRGTFTID